MSQQASSRCPGRPTDSDSRDICNRILASAKRLLKDNTYKKISVRKIAAEVGVNQAMISYYFKDKQGLFSALQNEFFDNFDKNIKFLKKNTDAIAPNYTACLMRTVIDSSYEHAPLLRLINLENMLQGSSMSECYIQNYSSMATKAVEDILAYWSQLGIYRADLNARYGALLIINGVIKPAMIGERLEEIYSVSQEELMEPNWFHFLAEGFDRWFLCPPEAGNNSNV